jgi:hypothetical protein
MVRMAPCSPSRVQRLLTAERGHSVNLVTRNVARRALASPHSSRTGASSLSVSDRIRGGGMKAGGHTTAARVIMHQLQSKRTRHGSQTRRPAQALLGA